MIETSEKKEEKEQEKKETEIKETKILAKEDIKQLIKNQEKSTSRKLDFMSIASLVAPGTPLRVAINEIKKAKCGALIVVDVPGLAAALDGGFRVGCKFTPQRLVELSKMDGAIILSSDMRRILFANTLLVPDVSIPTRETGTRHKAAERIAKQFDTLTIAISERRKTATIYSKEFRYVLRSSHELLRRAVESLQILEKQKEIFEDLLLNLNILEFSNLVNLDDVCLFIQRAQIILKIASIINRYITELGTEGSIIKIRLKELLKDVEKEQELVIKDYARLQPRKTKALLSVLSFDELLNLKNIAIALGTSNATPPRGYRILHKAGLGEKEQEIIMKKFRNLPSLLEASQESLISVIEKETATQLHKKLAEMKKQALLGKGI